MAGKHNASPATKAALRLLICEGLGGVENCDVIETHCGHGVMKNKVYANARSWVGIDLDKKSKVAIHADSKDVLRSVDLEFNLFDIDPFGSPWEFVWLVSQRLSHDRDIGLVITSGSQGRNGRLQGTIGGWSTQIGDATGYSRDIPNKLICRSPEAERFALACIRSWFVGRDVECFRSAVGQAQSARYFGCILRGAS